MGRGSNDWLCIRTLLKCFFVATTFQSPDPKDSTSERKKHIKKNPSILYLCWIFLDDFYTFVGWLKIEHGCWWIEHGCWMIQLWPAVESQVATASAIWNPCESSMSSKGSTVDHCRPMGFQPVTHVGCWGSNHHLRETAKSIEKKVLHGLHQRLAVDTLRHLKATCIMPSKTQKNLRTCHPLPSTARHRPAIAALSSILATKV